MTKVGFYGGKFLPLHMGHVYSIIQASSMVDELYIVLSHSKKRDQELCNNKNMNYISSTVRLRWLHQLTKDMDHVNVLEVEDFYSNDDYNWEEGARDIKAAIGKRIDFVFSSEPGYSEIFEELYPEAVHVVIDADRGAFLISATQIRKEGAYKHWEFIPEIVRPYFVKKVAILGTESCGKSTLTRNLAKIYNTTFVEEYGRKHCELLGGCDGIILEEDYPYIAYKHKVDEYAAIGRANKVVFIDTEAVVTQFYSELYNNAHQPVLNEIAKLQKYDLCLYLEPDVKWVNDGLRIHGDQGVREQNNERLKELLRENNIQYTTLSGTYQEKLTQSIRLVNELFTLTGNGC